MAKARAKKAGKQGGDASEQATSSTRSNRNSGSEPDKEWLKIQIERVLRRSFKTWTPNEIDHTIKRGKSLRERLESDKRDWVMTGFPALSCEYYTNLKNEYRPNSTGLRALSIDDTEENKRDYDAELLEAFAACFPPKPRRLVMMQWLQSHDQCTQKDTLNE